ncbi:MAG: O-antigen ligase family protein [Clostridia bacterium]|nr:O-antigen ligase family protein [Clostridia bacterium]
MANKEKISLDCIMACLYFVCLPLTVITTPFGSMLKVVTIPTVAVLSIRLLMGKSRLSFNYIHVAYTLYVLYTVSQLLFFQSDRAVTTTRDMVLGLLTFILISVRIYNEREKEFIETVWLVVGVICIVAAFTSHEVVSDIEERAVIKIFGFEEDQNQFCSYFIMPAIICVKRITERRKLTPLYVAMILLIMYAILKTGSRGGLIGVVVGLAAYILLGIKGAKKKIIIFTCAILVACIVIFIIFPLLPASVTERYSIAQVKEDKGSGRFELWEYLLSYTLKKPERIIRGSGVLSSYGILFDAPDRTFKNGVAHNTFVQIFSDQGLIGLILFSVVMIACIIRPLGTDKIYTCAFIALMAFSMSLTFYVFKPYLNIMIMCAMSFKGRLPEDILKRERSKQNAENN